MPKNLVVRKKLRLHPQIRNGGSVAQLNRASDYGSEGCGFESRRNHLKIANYVDGQRVGNFF